MKTSCFAVLCFAVTLGSCVPVRAQSAPKSKAVTLKRDAIPLRKALAELQQQSGIRTVDARNADDDPILKLSFSRTPFWTALDELARRAKCRISLSLNKHAIALVAGKPSSIAPSYSGIFRGSVRRVTVFHDFAVQARMCRVWLDFAWEPWYRPYYLEVDSYQATFSASKKAPKTLIVKAKGKGWREVHGQRAANIEDLQMPAPHRSVTHLQAFSGKLRVLGPSAMKTVVFKSLKQLAAGKPQKLAIAKNTTVRLKDFIKIGPNLWQLSVELHYPKDGPKFETHQTWLENNSIWLQHATRKDLKVPLHDYTALTNVSNYALIEYRFGGTGTKIALEKPGAWRLHYRTPESLIEFTVPFRFEHIPLP